MMTVEFKINKAALDAMLTGQNGPVVKILNEKGRLVENGAKRRAPVDTGRLRSSITTSMGTFNGKPAAFVGTNVDYAIYVHEGTGIYGPRGAPITPKRGKFLVFRVRGSGVTVFARQVRGVRPRPFLKDALQDVRG